MRDSGLMISLLEEMSKQDPGRLCVPMPADGWTGDLHQRHHHVELLVDAGHAEWADDEHEVARITNAGYDFLNAVTNPETGDKVKAKFVKLFNGGVPYIRAAQSVIEIVTKGMVG